MTLRTKHLADDTAMICVNTPAAQVTTILINTTGHKARGLTLYFFKLHSNIVANIAEYN